ncbi:MAG: cell division protein CrgA [Propionibacteriales bacterium]|nr:cell division protein CrgA [Propionibacteriales bacterium]
MSKPTARNPTQSISGYETSLVRCAVALLLIAVGIAWIVVYTNVAMDRALFERNLLGGTEGDPIPWMSNLYKWNYLIGFGVAFLGLIIGAHPKTPLGRGQGVVVGMLACFLLGLAWIVVYYFIAQSTTQVPVMTQLGQLNLVVGVAFMAVGFTFATKWE